MGFLLDDQYEYESWTKAYDIQSGMEHCRSAQQQKK